MSAADRFHPEKAHGWSYADYKAQGWTDAGLIEFGWLDRPTLEDLVREPYEQDCRKHDLAPDAALFTTQKINDLTNSEFLAELSYALKELLNP